MRSWALRTRLSGHRGPFVDIWSKRQEDGGWRNAYATWTLERVGRTGEKKIHAKLWRDLELDTNGCMHAG